MAQSTSNEERISHLERELEELKRQVAEHLTNLEHLERRQDFAADLDRALLDRVDRLSADLHAIRRDMQRGFEVQGGHIREIQGDLRQVKETVTGLVAGQTQIIETLSDHKAGIESLAGQVNELAGNVKELAGHVGEIAAGQAHIVELLRRQQPRRND